MEVKNNSVIMIPLNTCTATLSGDSRQDLSIFLNSHAKVGKTALFDAVSSGDSRYEVFEGNYEMHSNIVSDSSFACVRVPLSGDSSQDQSIALNNLAIVSKIALFNDFSSGDSRQEVYKGNFVLQFDIACDVCFAFVNVLSSGNSRQDFNIFTD